MASLHGKILEFKNLKAEVIYQAAPLHLICSLYIAQPHFYSVEKQADLKPCLHALTDKL